MKRLAGLAFLLVVVAVDVSSAQSLRYVNRSNPGTSQLSNHQHFIGTQRRAQNRKFGYQRSASHRQRLSQLHMRNIQRTAGRRGTRTGTAAEVVAQKRQQVRDRITTRRTLPTNRTSRLETATAQRQKARRQAASRASMRKSRTLAW